MSLTEWWGQQQDRRRQRKRLAEMRMARAAAADFDRLRTTRIEAHRDRYYPSLFAERFVEAVNPDQVAMLTEEAARMEANRDYGEAWTWRCGWTEASEEATQRIGADRVGQSKSKTLYEVAHLRVFREAAKDRQLVEYANGWADPFVILQRVPADIAVFLIGACYGRYSELLDEAYEWSDGLDT